MSCFIWRLGGVSHLSNGCRWVFVVSALECSCTAPGIFGRVARIFSGSFACRSISIIHVTRPESILSVMMVMVMVMAMMMMMMIVGVS